jgi:hypothetical protein
MPELRREDLQWCLRRLPKAVLKLLKEQPGKVFVAGGFVRACVAGEPANDIDLFVGSYSDARLCAELLAAKSDEGKVFATENAFTVKGYPIPVQIIHRWNYTEPEALLRSFDFTIAMGMLWYDAEELGPVRVDHVALVDDGVQKGALTLGTRQEVTKPAGWRSLVHENFYSDLASKRLVYTAPVREEAAGGSMLRVLKFYQRGYRIPLDSLAAVVARLTDKVREHGMTQAYRAQIITGLLREVDPNVDPEHVAHLPSSGAEEDDA